MKRIKVWFCLTSSGELYPPRPIFKKRPKACINLMGEKEGSEVTATGSSLHQFQVVTNGIEFQIVTKEEHYSTS